MQINGIIIQISILVSCVSVQCTHLSQARMTSIQTSSAGHVLLYECVCVCVHAACGIWCLGLSGCGESYESSLCNWNVMRTGEEFDWTGAFSHAPTSPRQMSNSFPNEKWHSPNPFLLLRPPPPPSSVSPSRLLRSPTLSDSLPAYLAVEQWLTIAPGACWNIKINGRLNQGLKECQCIHHFYLRLNYCVIDGGSELAIQL